MITSSEEKESVLTTEMLRELVDRYQLEVNGVRFWTPYFVNSAQVHDDQKRPALPGPFLGKGSPEELHRALEEALDKEPTNLSTPEDYRQFMHEHLIGVECSGFIYNLFENVLNQLGKGPLSDHIFWSRQELLEAYDKGIPWHRPELERQTVEGYPDYVDLTTICADWGWHEPRRMVRADRFWSRNTATPVESPAEIRIGDFITMRESTGSEIGHLVVVVNIGDDFIEYAHSSRLDGKVGGVHYGRIEVTNWNAPIESQEWEERDFYQTHNRYGIYRLKVLDGHRTSN